MCSHVRWKKQTCKLRYIIVCCANGGATNSPLKLHSIEVAAGMLDASELLKCILDIYTPSATHSRWRTRYWHLEVSVGCYVLRVELECIELQMCRAGCGRQLLAAEWTVTSGNAIIYGSVMDNSRTLSYCYICIIQHGKQYITMIQIVKSTVRKY